MYIQHYHTAVLHHLSTVDRRYAVISELLRITKIGGYVMIQAWALEQGGDSKRIFESQVHCCTTVIMMHERCW